MKRTVRVALVAAIVGLAAVDALAVDSVKVKFMSGYPPPNVSSEIVLFEVSRIDAAFERRAGEVDAFFDAVRDALLKYRVTGDWARLSPDAPSLRVDVEIAGRKVSLAVNADEHRRSRIPPTLAEMDDDVRHIAAMDEIIRLARARFNTQLAR
jgi:hypothetical protein